MAKGSALGAKEYGLRWNQTAHQSLQGRFRKALEEKAQCVWLCVCVFVFVLDFWPVRSADRATLRSAKPSFHGWSPVFRTWLCPRKSFLSHWRGPPAFTLGKEELFFSRNHTCMEREGRRLFSPAADYFPKATPAYKDGLPRNSSGRGVNLFFSRNHTSIEREGCRLCFLAADFAPRGDPCLQ